MSGPDSRVDNADGQPDNWLMWQTSPAIGSSSAPLTEKLRSLMASVDVSEEDVNGETQTSIRFEDKLIDRTEIPEIVLVYNVGEAISNQDRRHVQADLPTDIGRMDLDAIACSTPAASIIRAPEAASHWLDAMALYLGDAIGGHWVLCRRDPTPGSMLWILYDDVSPPKSYTPDHPEAPYPPRCT